MFITLEGPEGGGKSTQAPGLAAWLRDRGYDVLLTREPGGTSIGDQVRQIIMTHANAALTSEAEILLFCASRAQLVREVIRPSLARGRIVVCDRYADSTLAYQGYGRGLDQVCLRTILHFATGGLQPDLTLLLDLPASQGLERRLAATGPGAEWNRLDAEAMSFHERVREGYLALARTEPARWVVIPAGAPAEQVALAIRRAVEERLKDMG